MTVESWIPVSEAKGRYSISDHGRVINDQTGVVRVPNRDKPPNDYLIVDWKTEGKRVRRKVHLLVLEHFVCPRPPGMHGLHVDDDKSNCRVTNLYWGTHQQNMQDRIRNGHNPMLTRTHCIKCEWELVGDNLYINPAGARVCRHCRRVKMRQIRAVST